MSHDPSHAVAGTDKLDLHHRQQLSALLDGALAPDQARFLLRRLQHDRELAGRYERWQLCGQVLRGQVNALAEPDLGQRVAEAIRVVPAPAAAPAVGGRSAWTRWGGGAAALAASVAAVALFVARPQAPTAPAPALVAAGEVRGDAPPAARAAVPAAAPAQVSESAVPPAGTPATTLAAADPAPRASVRSPRTARPQAVVREQLRVAAADSPPRPAYDDAARVDAAAAPTALAASPLDSAGRDAFPPAAPLDARPWPRAALPQQASGAYTASFGEVGSGTRTFYPFEPRLPAAAPTAEAALPAPPPAEDAPR